MFVRSASERDLPAIRELLVETRQATYDAIYGEHQIAELTDDWHSIASLKARLSRPNSEFVVVDDGERLGGMAFATAAGDQTVVVLHQLYVHPACQGRGLGRLLLEEIEGCFPDASRIRVEVEAANAPALAFYEANGFVRTGTAEMSGPGDFEVAAEVLEKPLV